MGTSGIARVDFGATPSSEASIAVTGETGFLATSKAEAFFMEEATPDNSEVYHKALAVLGVAYADTFVAGTGFTVNVILPEGLATGTFDIPWAWN